MSNKRGKFLPKDKSKSIKTVKREEDSKLKTIVNMNGHNRRIVTILPSLSPNATLVYKRRYIASGAVTGSITIADLFNTWLVAATTTLTYPVMRAIRLKKISILSPVTTQGTTVFLQITPGATESTDNNFNSMPETYIDSSASIDKPAFISLKPSEISPFGSWHVTSQATGGIVADILAPSGSVLDLTLEVIPNNLATGTYTRAVAGATVGAGYARAILTNFTSVGFAGIG